MNKCEQTNVNDRMNKEKNVWDVCYSLYLISTGVEANNIWINFPKDSKTSLSWAEMEPFQEWTDVKSCVRSCIGLQNVNI